MKAYKNEILTLQQMPKITAEDRCNLALDAQGNKFVADFFQSSKLSSTGKVRPSRRCNSIIERIPERKRLHAGTYQWELAGTDVTANVLNVTFPKAQMQFDDDAFELYEYLLLSQKQQDLNIENLARFKQWQTLRNKWSKAKAPMHGFNEASGHYGPYYAKNYELHPQYPLAYYQLTALHNSVHSSGYALFMEQGTGKTSIVIARVCNEAPAIAALRGHMYRGIVVCPKNVRLNWKSEFEKFQTQKGKVTVLRGGELKRIKQITDAFTMDDGDEQFSIIVMSYETMCRSWNVLKHIEFDIGVLDEGHYIKSPKTKRSRVAHQLRDICDKRMLLTGTPIANSALDLYSQLEFLDEGGSGFLKWENFKSFYGVFKKQESGRETLIGMQNLPFMQERFGRKAFCCTKEEVLPDLPDKVYDIIEVEMTPDQAEYYKEVRDSLMLEIEADLDAGGNKQMVIQNVLTKLLRLAQITSGFISWDPEYGDDGELHVGKRIDRIDPNPKLEALIEEMKQKTSQDKTLIWACWVQDIKSIAARLELEGIDAVTYYGATKDDAREEAEWRFNNDRDCKILIGNAAAGGTGLNLLGYPPGHPDKMDTNCNHVVYYSQDWSYIKRDQSEGRAHRRGTREPVRITDLCVPNTIDEEIRIRVMRKKMHAMGVSDIRGILDKVLKGGLNV